MTNEDEILKLTSKLILFQEFYSSVEFPSLQYNFVLRTKTFEDVFDIKFPENSLATCAKDFELEFP